MATPAAIQQRTRLAFDQSRRIPAADSSRSAQTPENVPTRGAALRMAQSLATGQRNKGASLDRQIAGEAAARLGQAAGAYFGGVGAPIGKRLGRILGENWRIVVALVVIQIALPLLLLTIGFFIIMSTVQSLFF